MDSTTAPTSSTTTVLTVPSRDGAMPRTVEIEKEEEPTMITCKSSEKRKEDHRGDGRTTTTSKIAAVSPCATPEERQQEESQSQLPKRRSEAPPVAVVSPGPSPPPPAARRRRRPVSPRKGRGRQQAQSRSSTASGSSAAKRTTAISVILRGDDRCAKAGLAAAVALLPAPQQPSSASPPPPPRPRPPPPPPRASAAISGEGDVDDSADAAAPAVAPGATPPQAAAARDGVVAVNIADPYAVASTTTDLTAACTNSSGGCSSASEEDDLFIRVASPSPPPSEALGEVEHLSFRSAKGEGGTRPPPPPPPEGREDEEIPGRSAKDGGNPSPAPPDARDQDENLPNRSAKAGGDTPPLPLSPPPSLHPETRSEDEGLSNGSTKGHGGDTPPLPLSPPPSLRPETRSEDEGLSNGSTKGQQSLPPRHQPHQQQQPPPPPPQLQPLPLPSQSPPGTQCEDEEGEHIDRLAENKYSPSSSPEQRTEDGESTLSFPPQERETGEDLSIRTGGSSPSSPPPVPPAACDGQDNEKEEAEADGPVIPTAEGAESRLSPEAQQAQVVVISLEGVTPRETELIPTDEDTENDGDDRECQGAMKRSEVKEGKIEGKEGSEGHYEDEGEDEPWWEEPTESEEGRGITIIPEAPFQLLPPTQQQVKMAAGVERQIAPATTTATATTTDGEEEEEDHLPGDLHPQQQVEGHQEESQEAPREEDQGKKPPVKRKDVASARVMDLCRYFEQQQHKDENGEGRGGNDVVIVRRGRARSSLEDAWSTSAGSGSKRRSPSPNLSALQRLSAVGAAPEGGNGDLVVQTADGSFTAKMAGDGCEPPFSLVSPVKTIQRKIEEALRRSRGGNGDDQASKAPSATASSSSVVDLDLEMFFRDMRQVIVSERQKKREAMARMHYLTDDVPDVEGSVAACREAFARDDNGNKRSYRSLFLAAKGNGEGDDHDSGPFEIADHTLDARAIQARIEEAVRSGEKGEFEQKADLEQFFRDLQAAMRADRQEQLLRRNAASPTAGEGADFDDSTHLSCQAIRRGSGGTASDDGRTGSAGDIWPGEANCCPVSSSHDAGGSEDLGREGSALEGCTRDEKDDAEDPISGAGDGSHLPEPLGSGTANNELNEQQQGAVATRDAALVVPSNSVSSIVESILANMEQAVQENGWKEVGSVETFFRDHIKDLVLADQEGRNEALAQLRGTLTTAWDPATATAMNCSSAAMEDLNHLENEDSPGSGSADIQHRASSKLDGGVVSSASQRDQVSTGRGNTKDGTGSALPVEEEAGFYFDAKALTERIEQAIAQNGAQQVDMEMFFRNIRALIVEDRRKKEETLARLRGTDLVAAPASSGSEEEIVENDPAASNSIATSSQGSRSDVPGSFEKDEEEAAARVLAVEPPLPVTEAHSSRRQQQDDISLGSSQRHRSQTTLPTGGGGRHPSRQQQKQRRRPRRGFFSSFGCCVPTKDSMVSSVVGGPAPP